jgi:hypothetical protein
MVLAHAARPSNRIIAAPGRSGSFTTTIVLKSRGKMIPAAAACSNWPTNRTEKPEARPPKRPPITKRTSAAKYSYLVVNRPIKKAATGASIPTTRMNPVESHCTVSAEILNSLINGTRARLTDAWFNKQRKAAARSRAVAHNPSAGRAVADDILLPINVPVLLRHFRPLARRESPTYLST